MRRYSICGDGTCILALCLLRPDPIRTVLVLKKLQQSENELSYHVAHSIKSNMTAQLLAGQSDCLQVPIHRSDLYPRAVPQQVLPPVHPKESCPPTARAVLVAYQCRERASQPLIPGASRTEEAKAQSAPAGEPSRAGSKGEGRSATCIQRPVPCGMSPLARWNRII